MIGSSPEFYKNALGNRKSGSVQCRNSEADKYQVLKGTTRSERIMDLFFQILVEFGLPVAAASVMGIFIYIILKYILSGVVGQVGSLTAIISQLDNRVKTMNHDMIKLDLLISHALHLKPDLDRMSRADGKEDARKD